MLTCEDIQKEDQRIFEEHLLELDEILLPIRQMIQSKTYTNNRPLSEHSQRTLFFEAAFPIIGEHISKFHKYRWMGDKKGEMIKIYKCIIYNKAEQNCLNTIMTYLSHYQFPPLIKYKNEIFEHIKLLAPLKMAEVTLDRNIIVFLNGMLNIADWSFTPLPEDKIYMTYVPWNYYPNKISWPFVQLLDQATCEHKLPFQAKQTLLEMGGYFLSSRIDMQKAFFIYSKKPNTLKSPLLNIYVAANGKHASTQTSVSQLAKATKDRFALADMKLKRFQYHGDAPPTKQNHLEGIKAFITEETIDIEKKGNDRETFVNITHICQCLNKLPELEILTRPVAKRFGILLLNHEILLRPTIGAQKDPDNIFDTRTWTENEVKEWVPPINPITGMPEEIIKYWEMDNIVNKPEEMEGVISMFVNALRCLMNRGSFMFFSTDETMEIWRYETDPAYRFVRECCNYGYDEKGNSLIEPIQSLWRHYADYLDITGEDIIVPSLPKFVAMMNSFGIKVATFRMSGYNQRCFNKIKFRNLPGDIFEMNDQTSQLYFENIANEAEAAAANREESLENVRPDLVNQMFRKLNGP